MDNTNKHDPEGYDFSVALAATNPASYIIIGAGNCIHCARAKQFCDKRGLSYTYYDLGVNAWLKTLLQKTELTTIPQIFTTTGLHVGGYSDLEHFN